MSRIDDLIMERCPDGVEFKAVGDVSTKSSKIRWADARDNEFKYIDLTSVDRVTREIGNTATITAANAPSRAQQIVRTGDVVFATTRPAQMRWAVIPPQFDGQIASTGYCVLRPDTSVVLTKFLAHVLGGESFRQYVEANQVAGNYPSIPDGRVRRYRIPVPPLEVQREIVRVLDQFTQLEAELEAELEARRRQYDFYRDSLLAFPDDVERVSLGDFGTIFGGLTGKSKTDFSDGNARFASYVNVFKNIALDTQADDFVRIDTGERQRALAYGDVIFTGSSESVAEVGMTSVVTARLTEPMYLNSFCIGFRPYDIARLIPEFAKHLFRSSSMRSQIVKTASGVTRINVSKARLAKIQVPLPEKAEQVRIARILDQLDELTNDLSIGLPAELAARRKQYEYYRDKLLTFKELVA
ncbi:restriction endonuclease subunit S [Salinibacterium sp. SYSU T00001]|uniref:restriction endonuclease subunit S n=1 Tax=Homoserinimonas sedimenticola TaxID=2986805 RepID=UPI0022355962|nr:restriction endonuclease subunit S [Salinibacterium sedimenticola]MCW4386325.1 restriction endonuclease subunit S [Salinibacterium sedimenticola]